MIVLESNNPEGLKIGWFAYVPKNRVNSENWKLVCEHLFHRKIHCIFLWLEFHKSRCRMGLTLPQSGSWPDYLMNRYDKKNEGPFEENNFTEIEKYLLEKRSGLWKYRDSLLKVQLCVILEPNTNAQRMSWLSHLLRSLLARIVRDCYSVPWTSVAKRRTPLCTEHSLESRAIHPIENRTCDRSFLDLQTPDQFEEGVHVKIIFQNLSTDITFAPKLKRDMCPFKHKIFKKRAESTPTCVCCKILAARIAFHVCVCVW